MDIKRARPLPVIIQNFYVPDPQTLADIASFLDSGNPSSTPRRARADCVSRGDVQDQILDEELLPENLDSLAAVEGFTDEESSAADQEGGPARRIAHSNSSTKAAAARALPSLEG